jgi:pimeloyl-ACP methyl ester carboxylesterase
MLGHFGIVSAAAGLVLAVGFLHPFSRSVKDSDYRAAVALGSVKPIAVAPLSGWLITHAGEARPTIVFIHGRSSNRMQMFPLAKAMFERGRNVVLWDQRHHGNSGGAATYGKNEVGDVLRVIDDIRKDSSVDPKRISLVGFSLGAAMSIGAAAADTGCRIHAIVADSAYANLREPGFWYVRLFGWVPGFITWPTATIMTGFGSWVSRLDLDRLNPADWAAAVRVPALLVHGEKDRRVPPDSSRQIYDRLPFKKEIWLVPGAGHTKAFSTNPAAYIERVSLFLEDAGPAECSTT